MRRKRTIPARLTQNTYNGKSIGVTNAPTRLEAEGCWALGEITSAIRGTPLGTAQGAAYIAADLASTWPPNHLMVTYNIVAGGGGGSTAGGGAGGMISDSMIMTLGVSEVTVGAGGASAQIGGSSKVKDAADAVYDNIEGNSVDATGGGPANNGNGGSGAGGYYTQGAHGEGIAGQGNDGGSCVVVNNLSHHQSN